ncbi:hypothetical protein ACEPAI_6241 [Sanghuangporus weigelae]
MNATRVWALCSSSSRPLASRLATQQLDVRLFSTVARPNYSQYFTRSWQSTSQTGSATQSLFTQSSLFLRHALSFGSTHPTHSRVGWYRDYVSTRAAPKRMSGGRKPQYDFHRKSPLERLRRWFDQIPSDFIVWTIIGLNGAVFIAWQAAILQKAQGEPSLYVQMQKNFQNSWRNIREGRFWCIIGAAFSHSNAAHIFMNLFSFYFLAPPIVNLIGNTSFLALYFLGGIACSTFSLLLNQSVKKRDGNSHGASGAIFAVMSFFACVSPNTTFLIFGLVPMPAWACVSAFFLWDGFSTLTDRASIIDGAGHVGGVLAGVVYYIAKRRLLF